MFLLFLIQLLGAAHAESKGAFSWTNALAFDECGMIDGHEPDFKGHCDEQKWISAFSYNLKAPSENNKNFLSTSVSFDSSIMSVTEYNETADIPDNGKYKAAGDIGMIEGRVVITDSVGKKIPVVPDSVIMLRDIQETFIGMANFQCITDPDTNETLNCDEINESLNEVTVATTFNFFGWPLENGQTYKIDIQYRLTVNADASSYKSNEIAITGTSLMAGNTIIETMEQEVQNGDLFII